MAFLANISLTMFWLIVLVVLVVIELLTMGLTTIWFAGGALVATIAAVFNTPFFVQVILFLVVSVVLLFFTRPLAVKYFNKDRVRTNAESLVGRQAIVISEIDNLQGIGQVNVGGMEWSARTRIDGVRLPVGTVTTILGINGVKLIVEERKGV
ncbi:MAG: NfeD family protein [Lachnospiraceae bacterium]